MHGLRYLILPSIRDTAGRSMMLSLLGVGLAVMLLNALVPQGHPLYVPTFTVSLLGKYICYAVLAVALDLVWGYCGILSLGHGAFFGLGGYAMGMYLMRQIGDRGAYGHPVLPDFMVFLSWDELPWYWLGFDNFWFALFMVMFIPGLLAFVFGWMAFRSRVTGVYLSIITQALVYAMMLAFLRNEMGFGGTNGLTDFREILGFPVRERGTRIGLLVASIVLLMLCLAVGRFITDSKLGRVLVSIRDAESKTRFIGYKVEHYKLFIFVVSAVMAGLAGALYVPQVGIINPGEFSPVKSIEIVVWVAVGGRGSLIGAVLGAVLVSYAKTVLTSAMPNAWLFFLGGLFVVSTLFFPKGIMGMLQSDAVRKQLDRLPRIGRRKEASS